MSVDRAAHYDTELVLWKFRPPCPRLGCLRRTWPDRGFEDQAIFWCPLHGFWVPVELEDAEGTRLPLFRWNRYVWRFL